MKTTTTTTTTTTTPDEAEFLDVGKAFNYASLECGAKVLAANAEASDAAAALDTDADSYMLNECAADKWMHVELCEEIRIVAVTLQNAEFFASPLRDVELSVASFYPTDEWLWLANVTMTMTRDRQFFRIASSQLATRTPDSSSSSSSSSSFSVLLVSSALVGKSKIYASGRRDVRRGATRAPSLDAKRRPLSAAAAPSAAAARASCCQQRTHV